MGNLSAESILKKAGIRRTDARIKMLDVMLASETPLEAKELHEQAGTEDLWLSTVYRNLELFMEKGLVQQISPPDSESVFYHLEVNGHNHYAVCEECHRRIALDLCPVEDLEPQLTAAGFQPTHHRLEVFGICESCHLNH